MMSLVKTLFSIHHASHILPNKRFHINALFLIKGWCLHVAVLSRNEFWNWNPPKLIYLDSRSIKKWKCYVSLHWHKCWITFYAKVSPLMRRLSQSTLVTPVLIEWRMNWKRWKVLVRLPLCIWSNSNPRSAFSVAKLNVEVHIVGWGFKFAVSS